MSRTSQWLVWGIVLVGVHFAPREAIAQSEPVKPYVVVILDTSGSMDDPGSGAVTGFGPPSCPGTIDTKEDHAKCAIFNLANSYAEMVLGLGRFRATTNPAGTCGLTGECGTTAGPCNATANGDEFQILVPLLDNNHADIAMWTDFVCTTCDPAVAGGNLEMYSSGATPLAGSLEGAQLYWQGASSPSFGPYWSGPGDDPIRDDPLNDVFVGGEQCRPYITILLTDGDETCATITQATDAATALLTTSVDGLSYRIETKPIGFGKPPGDPEIEAIARAGGNLGDGVGGANEGAYAQNEEELQLEISAIIADAIKFEQCNELDDDCDLDVDEDFPNKGLACDDGEEGICLGTGTFVCNAAETGTECVITDPGLTPTGETCDGEDDDCDGTVDEGVCTGCGTVELCNNLDDDCDLAIDEDLTRQCGTDLGICNFGTQVCSMGVWGPCNDNPSPGDFSEACNGLDDDCDGTVDGFSEDCVGNEEGPCEAGTRFCPTDGSGVFGSCVGVIGPVTETCDLIDNDCDVDVDEDTGGADCSGSCGVGTTVCVDGNLECDSASTGGPDDCNGFDEDCDTLIDEDYVSPGSCTTAQVCNGNFMCISGVEVCVGETIEPEVCNCEDDDCDTVVDDGNLCAPGSTCVDPSAPGYACQCAEPCAPGEFPCAIGEVCVDDFCLVDPCFQVDCPPETDGDLTECVVGECVRSCDLITCPAGFVCVGSEGQCRPDNCNTFPDYCTADQVCVDGACVSDPCAGVTCPADEYCVGGTCHGSCAGVECPDGQRCVLGVCEADPCPDGCPGSQVCNDESGQCVPDPCQGQPSCPEGEWCNPQTGDCEQDPCLGVECPGTDQVCIGGTCFGVDDLVDAGVDASDGEYVTAGGGGGCAAGGDAGAGAVVLLLALVVALRGRRWALLVGLAALLSGCDFDSYCIDCPRDGGGGDDGDGGNGDGGGIVDAGDLPDACIPTGLEVCNGLDEDCDGTTDEEATSVGDPCGTDVGNCTAGVIECNAGELECTGVPAAPEECDDADNDCDGQTDEGNPEGGQMCGSDVGECIGGFTQCTAGGVIDCVGDSGTPGAVAETCNGLDDDCDAVFDEDVATMGPCGFPDVGECEPGVLTCVGGGPQCVGGQGPQFEECDVAGLDSDCDGDPSNGYDLDNDGQNCGACGNSCNGTIMNAIEACSGGTCVIASCDSGFHDDITVAGPDCLYACDFQGPFEACNDADDDCDGITDENVAAPGVCDQDGECAGTLASCEGGVFVCAYPPTVPVDVDGNIEPETACDTLDNDCDGDVDESHPDVGEDCAGGTDVGICQDTGVRECDPGDALAPTICVLDDFGLPAEAGETCDLEDDDCDGTVDEGALTGDIQEWVSIGGGTDGDPVQIMKYEASRPDARSDVEGVEDSYVCSRPGVEPWTGVTQPDAEAACLSIGARLCTEQEWHRACAEISGTVYPVIQAATGDAPIFIEAEDYYALVPVTDPDDGVLRTWVPDTTGAYSGISGLRSSPNSGQVNSSAEAPTESPRLDYQIQFSQTGTHYVWVKAWGPSNNDDILHVGLDGAQVTSADNIDTSATAWTWFRRDNSSANNRTTINVTATGLHTINVWMGDDGARIDAIYVTRNSTITAPTNSTSNGGDWSFQNSPDVYVGTTCNGVDNGAGVILDTGAKPQCNASWPAGNGGGVFDLSGNVKEWTAERRPEANPIRGGAYNNLAQGISCGLAFTLADDAFFFDNVGFRCCRD